MINDSSCELFVGVLHTHTQRNMCVCVCAAIMLVGRFCFQFVQLFGETKEIDTLRIPTIHTIYLYMKPTYVCVLVCVFIVFSHYYLYIIFFAICRCYFITYVDFIRPVQL